MNARELWEQLGKVLENEPEAGSQPVILEYRNHRGGVEQAGKINSVRRGMDFTNTTSRPAVVISQFSD